LCLHLPITSENASETHDVDYALLLARNSEQIIIHSYVLGAHDVSGESWQLVTAIFMMKVMV
jgi:hypothetical protein